MDGFFTEQFRWLLLNLVLASEKNLRNRKLEERLIAYVLIDLFHVQMQKLANRSITTRAFICHLSLNFIITKYLKQEVGDDLSVCVDERSPYGLSVTEDIKIYQCHVIIW